MEDNIYKCFFCNEYYDTDTKEPRVIFDCKHSICLECLNGFFSKNSY